MNQIIEICYNRFDHLLLSINPLNTQDIKGRIGVNDYYKIISYKQLLDEIEDNGYYYDLAFSATSLIYLYTTENDYKNLINRLDSNLINYNGKRIDTELIESNIKLYIRQQRINKLFY